MSLYCGRKIKYQERTPQAQVEYGNHTVRLHFYFYFFYLSYLLCLAFVNELYLIEIDSHCLCQFSWWFLIPQFKK